VAVLPVLTISRINHEQQHSLLSFAFAAGIAAALLNAEPADCMGKRKKKDSVLPDDMYEVDFFKARRLVKGTPEYLVHWKGFDDKHDTWEPLANLAGCEPDIAAFEAEEKKANEEYAQQQAAKKAARQASKGTAGGTQTTLPGAGGPDNDGGDGGEAGGSNDPVVKQEVVEGAKSGRRSNPFWSKVKATNVPGEYECQEPTASGAICGAKLHPGQGATAIKRHYETKHKRTYQEVMGYLNADVVDLGVLSTDGAQRTITAQPFSEERKAECNMACARWLVKSARAITLPECDKPFRAFIETLTRGAWSPPDHHAINDCILKLAGAGQVRVQRWFADMVIDGVKPSMAGDIWSDGGCSLMGICLYGINSAWKMDEWLVAATPFGSTRHTGDAIDELTCAALKRQGIKWREGGTVYEAIHGKVSDNASNMAKGWAGFDGGFCADHTLELSVKKYTGADGIKETFSRDKGIVGYFHRSTSGIQDLTTIQKACGLPEKQPIQDVVTRWFSSYGMVDWFREQQQAVQMYDVKHGAEAVKNDAYKDNRLQHKDWAINEQSVAVLAPVAQATKLLEGTKYVTISLVLPYTYRLIEGTADGMLYLPWKPTGQQWLRASQLVPEVRAARKLLHTDLKKRWLEDMPTEQRAELDIATLLDPRFKTYVFPGCTTDLDDAKKVAMEALKGAWTLDWKPRVAAAAAPAAAPTAAAPAAVTTASATAAAKMGASSSFFAMPIAPPPTGAAAAAAAPVVEQDDLEKYLALPAETNVDLDVLAWWKAKDCKDGMPVLAKMARQYLGRPASSAGVERMFSKAGKLYDDAKKSQNDESLEVALFAAANAD